MILECRIKQTKKKNWILRVFISSTKLDLHKLVSCLITYDTQSNGICRLRMSICQNMLFLSKKYWYYFTNGGLKKRKNVQLVNKNCSQEQAFVPWASGGRLLPRYLAIFLLNVAQCIKVPKYLHHNFFQIQYYLYHSNS